MSPWGPGDLKNRNNYLKIGLEQCGYPFFNDILTLDDMAQMQVLSMHLPRGKRQKGRDGEFNMKFEISP